MGAPDGRPKPVDLPEEAPKRRGRRPKGMELSETTVGNLVCTAFGGVAMLTQHPHWIVTPKQAEPITEPLTRMLNSLPAAIVERIEKHLDPLLLAYGATVVILPRWQAEQRLQRGGSVTPVTPLMARPAPQAASDDVPSPPMPQEAGLTLIAAEGGLDDTKY